MHRWETRGDRTSGTGCNLWAALPSLTWTATAAKGHPLRKLVKGSLQIHGLFCSTASPCCKNQWKWSKDSCPGLTKRLASTADHVHLRWIMDTTLRVQLLLLLFKQRTSSKYDESGQCWPRDKLNLLLLLFINEDGSIGLLEIIRMTVSHYPNLGASCFFGSHLLKWSHPERAHEDSISRAKIKERTCTYPDGKHTTQFTTWLKYFTPKIV